MLGQMEETTAAGRSFASSAGRGHTVPGYRAAGVYSYTRGDGLLLVYGSSGWVPCFPSSPMPAQLCHGPFDVPGKRHLT